MEWWGRVGSRLRAMHAVDLTGPKIWTPKGAWIQGGPDAAPSVDHGHHHGVLRHLLVVEALTGRHSPSAREGCLGRDPHGPPSEEEPPTRACAHFGVEGGRTHVP